MVAGLNFEVPSVSTYLQRLFFSPEVITKLVALLISAVCVPLIIEEGIERNPFEEGPNLVCYYGSNAEDYDSHRRVCYSGLAAGVTSILVATALITLEMIVPCFVKKSWKRLIRTIAASSSLLMAIFWITTSTLILRQFINYCDALNEQENRNICQDEGFNTFLTVPIFQGICAVLWVLSAIIPLLRAVKKAICKTIKFHDPDY